MSADNYLYIQKWDGKYFVEYRSASAEYDDAEGPSVHATQYDTVTKAVGMAHQQDDTEYGVRMSDAVLMDLQSA